LGDLDRIISIRLEDLGGVQFGPVNVKPENDFCLQEDTILLKYFHDLDTQVSTTSRPNRADPSTGLVTRIACSAKAFEKM
jgi:hypothetical protein